MLFSAWPEEIRRPTKDLDLLGYGEDSVEALEAAFRTICRVEVEPDGISFKPDSIQVNDIREEQEYHGKRV